MANPYAVGSPASGSGSFTLSITVTTATAAGDKIEVAAVAANGLVTGVTDSRGNSYVQTDGDSTGAGTALFHYIADGATTALQVGDTITVSYTLSWALKIAIAIATSGLAATALDKHNIATNAGSPSPSVTSAALAQASETVIGVIGDNFTSSGGDPVWAAGWTKIISGSVTGYPHVSFAYKQVNSTSAVTANGTISSSKWTAIISSLKNSATVTVTSPSLPNGTVGIPYSAPNETAAGGTQSYTWAKTTGTLPPGVSISSAGVWSGIPTTPGTFSFNIAATDGNGVVGNSAQTIIINASAPAGNPYFIGSNSAASGGGTDLIVPVSNPAGAGDSIIVGALVSVAGVTVTVFDSAGNTYLPVVSNTAQSTAQVVTFESDGSSVLTPGVDTITVRYSANTSAQGAIAVGDNNVSGNDKFVAASGSSTAPSSGSSGSLGQAEEHAIAFIVDAAAGGVPSWAAPWSSGVLGNVQGGAGARLSAAYQVVNATTALTASAAIATAAWSAAEITTRVNPVSNNLVMSNGIQGEAYSQTLEATGGVGPYTWTIPVGSLPTGLSLSSGVVSGTPSVNGVFSFTTRATDANGVTGDLAQTITILPGGASGVPSISLPNNILSAADATGEVAGFTWAADVNANAPAATSAISLAGAKSIFWTSAADGLTQISTGFYSVFPNKPYIASGFMLPAGLRDCQVGVEWYTSGNVLIRQDLGPVNPAPGASWVPVYFSGTSPANAAKCKVVASAAQSNKGDATHIELTYLAQSGTQVLVDWLNPVFSSGSQAGQDFMDVSMWIRMDTGITMNRGRQDSISEIQAGSVSFSLQNDTGLFTRKKNSSLISVIGGDITLQRRYQVNITDEFGSWNTRADGLLSGVSYGFDNTGNTSIVSVSGSDVLSFLNRQDALSCWTKETVMASLPQWHWSLNDSGNAGGSGLAAETGGNNGPPLRVWNSDNTKTAVIGWQDSSGGVETLANAVKPGQPDGGEFWQPGSNQPTSAVRGLDSGGVGPNSPPISSVYLTPKLTAQTSANWFTGNLGYKLRTVLPSFIDPTKSNYTFEMWFTMDPGIKTNVASKFGPYVPFSLGSSIDGSTLVAGIFLNGASPHTFKVNTYAQPPGFLGSNFPGNAPPATTNSISQSLVADTVPIPHHLVITINQSTTAPTVSAYLDGVLFGSTFTLPPGQRYDSICLGGAYGGTGHHWGGISLASVYNRILSANEVTTHCQMGQYGSWEQTTDDCISTLSGFTDAPGFWLSLDSGHRGLTLTDYQDVSGSNALAAMQIYEKAEDGLLFVNASGQLKFHTRDWREGHGAPDLLLPPDTFDGSQIDWGVVDQFMINEMGVASQAFPTGAGSINKDSQAKYGVYTQNSVNSPLQLPLITWSRAFGALGLTSFYYFSDPNLDDRADWEANTHTEPWMTPASILVDLLTLNKTSTGLGISDFYALEIDSLIAPSGTLPVSFPDANLSKEWFVEGIVEAITEGTHTISFYCSPAETQRAWIPGDPVYGVLGSTSRIGVSQADNGPEAAFGKDASHDAGRPYWPPQFGTTMNNPSGDGHGFIGATDIRGLTDNLSLLLEPPMLVVGATGQTQTFPSGTNGTPQVFWDNIYADTAGGMGLMPGWPNWYVVTVPGYYDIDVSLVWATGTINAGFAVAGHIVVAQAAAQGLAAGTVNPVTNGAYVAPAGEQVRINVVSMNPVDCPTTRMYLGIGDMVTVAGFQSSGATKTTGIGLGGSKFSMLWRGWSQVDDRVQINSLITGGSVSNAKSVTTFTKTYQNTHTYAYFGKQNNPPWNRRNTDLNVYQGLPSSNNSDGSESTQVVFPYSQIHSDLNPGAGTVAIKSVTLTGSNISGFYKTGARGLFGYSTQTPGGGTFDATSVSNRAVTKQWFNTGKTVSFSLPAAFATNFQGSGKFILLGDGATTDPNEYGVWKGGPGSWQLSITYTVTV